MAAGLSFKIKGDSTGFVSSVKSAEKSIGSLADKVRGAGLGRLSEQLRRASTSLKSFSSPKVEVDPIIKSVGKLNDKLKGLSKDKKKVNLQLNAYQAVDDLKKLQEQLKGVLSQRGRVELDADGQRLEKKLIRFKAKLAELKESQGAGIVLDADGRKLSNKVDRLKAKLAEIRERNPGVPLDANAEKLATKLKSAQGQLDKLKASAPKPVIDTDSSKLEQKIVSVKARLLEIKGAAPRVPLDADGKKLEVKLDRFKAKLAEFQKAESASIVLDADGRKLNNKIDRLKSKLAQMRELNPVVPLDANAEKLVTKLKIAQGQLDKLKASAPEPVIDVDVAKLKSKIKGIDSRLAKLKEASPKIPLDAEGLLLERKLKVYQEKLKKFGKPVPKPVIDLDAEKLQVKIKSLNNKLAQMRERNPGVPLDADSKKLEAKIRSSQEKLELLKKSAPKPVIDIDVEKLKSKIKSLDSRLAKLKEASPKIPLDAEGLLLERKLKVYQEKLKNFGKPVPKPVIDLNAEKLEAKIKSLNNKLKGMKASSPKVPLDADAQKLVAKIKAAKEKLRGLASQGAKVNLRLNSKQVSEKISFIKSFLKKISNQETEVKVALKLKQAGFDRAKKKLQKALTMRGVAKIPGLKGWQKALLMAGVTAYKTAAAISGPLSRGLMLAAHASNKLSVAGNKLNKTLAVVAVAGVKSLKAGLRGIAGSAKLSAIALRKLASAALKLVGAGLSGLKGITFGVIKAGAVAAAAAVAALAFSIKSAISNASGIENMGVAFTAITGSVQGSTDLITHLREESKRTGVEMGTMATMVRRLMANGMDITAAKKMTSSLLDISGTLGLGTEEAKLLGIAISQVQAKGVVSMEELRQQIAEKGVPVFDVLAQKLGVTKGKLMEMVAAGKVGSEVLMEAFSNLEGPLAKFRGGAEKMGMTAQGSFNRLKATMADVFAQAGEPLLDGLSGAISTITQKITEWGPKIKAFAESAGSFVRTMAQAFKQGQIGEMVKLGLIVAAKGMISTLWSGLKAWVATLFNYMVEGGKMLWGKITDMTFWQGIGEIFRGAGLALEVAGLKLAKALSPGSTRFDNAIKQRGAMSGLAIRNGMDMMGRAGDGRNPADVLKEQVDFFKGVFEDAQKDPLMDGSKELDRLKDIYEAMRKLAEEDKKKREEAMTATSPEDPSTKPPKPEKPGDAFFKPIVTSMQKIGGASIGNNAGINLDQRRNDLLEQVAASAAASAEWLKQSVKPESSMVDAATTVAKQSAAWLKEAMSSALRPGAIQVGPVESQEGSVFSDSIVSSINSVNDAFLNSVAVASDEPEFDAGSIGDRLSTAVGVGLTSAQDALTKTIERIKPSSGSGEDQFLRLDTERNALLRSIDTKIGNMGNTSVFA